MSKSIRGISLVAFCAAMIAMVWPSAAPVAGDHIVSNLEPGAIVLNVPAAAQQGLPFSPIPIESELDIDQTPRAGGMIVSEPAPRLDLAALVGDVADMQRSELDDDMRCLASAIYYEARGESLEGQLAVAQVILNRAENDRWPDDICAVVYQSGQFSFTFDGKPDVPAVKGAAWKRAEAIAIIAVGEGWQDVTDKATFFHATYVKPGWRRVKEQTRRIGGHIFYR
ncbi:MAG: cell wall hydrolase [Sphingosinicella sp.]|nr:cell wall hydrolase [Sphingosinicella sp.]